MRRLSRQSAYTTRWPANKLIASELFAAPSVLFNLLFFAFNMRQVENCKLPFGVMLMSSGHSRILMACKYRNSISAAATTRTSVSNWSKEITSTFP